MAHKKGGGSTRNGRDSNPQYRGVKVPGGAFVMPGDIIVRQCGTVFKPGRHVRIGRDNTLYAGVMGIVKFQTRQRVTIDPAQVLIDGN